MSLLKKGVRFNSQDTGETITRDEIPFIIANLTLSGTRRAAIIGFEYMRLLGFSIDKALEVMGAQSPEARCGRG